MGFFFEDEEIDAVKKLSAGQAAVPMYGSMQTKGIGAAGDIFGIDTAPVDLLNEQLEESLKGFTPKFPGIIEPSKMYIPG